MLFINSALVVVCGAACSDGRCALNEPGGRLPLTPGRRAAGVFIAATGVDDGAVAAAGGVTAGGVAVDTGTAAAAAGGVIDAADAAGATVAASSALGAGAAGISSTACRVGAGSWCFVAS
jgi:hypothetical protein